MKHLIPSELGDYATTPTKVNVTGLRGTRFSLCHVGIVPEGKEGRRKSYGEVVPGPWCYTVTHPLVIDTQGGSGREMREALSIAVGEHFTIEGCPGTYAFRSPNQKALEGDGAKLEQVA